MLSILQVLFHVREVIEVSQYGEEHSALQSISDKLESVHEQCALVFDLLTGCF
jgi:hypothetical protein